MKPIQFEASAYKDYIDWAKSNEDVFDKINKLIIDIDRNLSKGLASQNH